MSAPNLSTPSETPQEDIRNALAILEACAIRLPGGLVNLKEDEYEAIRARCHRAVAKLEGEARK
jgi:hypothetical protein